MKWTSVLVSILCLICLLSTGYFAEGSGQLAIAVPYLLRDLPLDWRPEAGKSLSFSVKVTKPPYYSGGRLTATEWMSLKVNCEDYAAYGKLTFATTESSITEAFPIVVKIPRDVNGNKIADGWRDDETTADPNNNNPSKNYVANSDLDRGPNAQLGDNVTVLDEYRGLDVNDTWTETDPEAWDVFLRHADGLSSAGSLPNMTPHYMGLIEVDHVRGHVMPYAASSFGLGVNAVYAIRLRKNLKAYDSNDPDRNTLGRLGIGPPSAGTHGEVWPERIRVQLSGNQTLGGLTAYIVAHEIGHGVHLDHCPNVTDLDCYMWEAVEGSEQHVTQYHNHHLVDYDLSLPTFFRQSPANVPTNRIRVYDPMTDTWSLELDSSGNALLTPSGVLYTGTAGGTHTASLTVQSGWTSIYWYLKSPSESGLGTSQFMDTDSTGMYTTASYTYTFPSGVSGDYVLTAYTTLSDNTVVQPSYTVTVSLPATVTYACGVHLGPASDANAHSLQASCPSTNTNGDNCTVTGFYLCQPHTHTYPAPTIVCWRSDCPVIVSDAAEHKAFCDSGLHSFWPGCPDLNVRSWHQHWYHELRNCSRCGSQFRLCNNNSNSCSNGGNHWQ